MENTTMNTIRQHIIDSEKQRTNPYLDIKGHVTIGTGFKIDSEDAFAALPLVNESTGAPSTEAEKRRAWRIMQRERARALEVGDLNRKAEDYEKLTDVRMPKAEQDKRLDREIETRVGKIRREIGAAAWNRLTDGQKAVAVDVHYANEGTWASFRKFKAALRAGDGAAIARESTFYTDRKNRKRDPERLRRNWQAATGLDRATAQKQLDARLAELKTRRDRREREAGLDNPDETGAGGRRFALPPKKPEPPRTIDGGTGDDRLDGGSGDDDLGADAATEAATDAATDADGLVDALTERDGALEDILAKDPANLTEGEVRQVMLARRNAGTDGERQKLFGVEKAFYEDKYGTGAVTYDVTGRMVPPAPVKPINRTPVAARGGDGRPAAETLNRLARAVAEPRNGETGADVVRALQTGLNIASRARADQAPYDDLKDDGVPGPKTRGAFKTAARALGPARVKEGMALGRFRRFAEAPTFGGLRSYTENAFGDLFRKPSGQKRRSTDEGFGLQAAINDLGRERIGAGFKPIREDGDIGRKTEAAFARVLPAAGADRFTFKLGESLGFFDDDDDGFLA